MKAELTATIEGGVLKPDAALPFPDHTRVKVTIEPVEPANPRLAAWERLLALCDAKPIVGDGKRFNREELYDRD
jgi:predicted DNA-binding antitoxin AbrB/MazE fold protein